ncbi:MAG: hypothetical protein AB1416_05175 [Actinomycetota bacterium]
MFRRRGKRPDPVRLVRVAVGRHQPEAEMLADILRRASIPALVRGLGAGTPEMLAAAPHEVLVPEERALEAHALIDPMEPLHPDAGGEGE